ncbi:eukaryotic translation initiation factor 5A-2-like [Centroberyx affinis]|uniref:eukaryotic translation initiation factor 5A-2-like n=1 Tax=Centroberyx affinis TaxID=166261 RepID=UPI003A5C5538
MEEDWLNTESISGSSDPILMQCSALKKNGHVMLKGRPCKIIEMSTSKTGKHGHAKVHLVGLDLITGETHEDICPSTCNMEIPVVHLRSYYVNCVEDGLVHLTDEMEEEKLILPQREGQAVLGGQVTVITVMGEKAIATVI